MRYVPYNSASTLPDWLFAPRVRPRICVSMGTVPIPEGVDGLTAAVAGMRDLDVEVVVSGAGVHGIEDLPPNARRVGWLPHHLLLPTCDVFVHHGGSGSSMAALGAGRPQLVLPQMCDQFSIASRLTAAGVARSVAPSPSGPRPRSATPCARCSPTPPSPAAPAGSATRSPRCPRPRTSPRPWRD